MRIRTLKPEFWTHPVMGRLSSDARLLAIGLLNLADDFGFFLADPSIVRSALQPFTEDSLRTHTQLSECSRHGWIEVRNHPTHGAIGLVVNFTKHQRINRPTPSKLKQYWDVASLTEDSLRTHGGLTEASLLEQGTGNREGNREHDSASAKKPRGDVSALQAIWNEHRGRLPEWARTGKKREGQALRALKETPLGEWSDVVKRMAASDFCCGQGSTGWIATPDFLLKPGTATSVLEGKYDNRHTAAQKTGPVGLGSIDYSKAAGGMVTF